ncbi:hypothetical protein UlMin_025794 [Ulmus minor]
MEVATTASSSALHPHSIALPTPSQALEQPPSDLASYLYKNIIVYLGMSLVPSYEDAKKPIYMYINSTGTTKLYTSDIFRLHKTCTRLVHWIWGEAALLLATGAKGNRSALPSSTIMIKFQGQATYIEIARKEVNNVKTKLVNLLAKHVEKSPEQIEADIKHPKYFSPNEAVEYGIINKVIYNERSPEDRGVVADLKKAQLIRF